jgi:hypothetical protein
MGIPSQKLSRRLVGQNHSGFYGCLRRPVVESLDNGEDNSADLGKQTPVVAEIRPQDPHLYAEAFASLPHLDFLDVGWGANVLCLRKHLPQTFLNIRLNPAEMINRSVDQIEADIIRLVGESDNPWLTGVCCINMDHQVTDDKVTAILCSVKRLRDECKRKGSV